MLWLELVPAYYVLVKLVEGVDLGLGLELGLS